MSTEPAARAPDPLLVETGDLPPTVRDPSEPTPRRRFRRWQFGIKMVLFLIVVYWIILPLVTRIRREGGALFDVQPVFLAIGVSLEIGAWIAYSMVTYAALGDADEGISRRRLFRIQMSTKALTNTVPAGSAAGPALGFRLLTLSGVRGADAGFALATSGIGSAVVLNALLWTALAVSIPVRGWNPGYATAALAGVIVMLLAVGLVLGLLHGQGRAEAIIRAVAGKLRVNGDKAVDAIRQVGLKVEELLADRQLMKRVALWSLTFWLLDATALWVFLRAFGISLDPVGLLVMFGVANLLAAIPITPGGVGIVDSWYLATLSGFGAAAAAATPAVVSYRVTQFIFPIFIGGVMYLSLRVGPWRIERRVRLEPLRTIAHEDVEHPGETNLDFVMRVWPKRMVRTGPNAAEAPSVAEVVANAPDAAEVADLADRRAARDGGPLSDGE